MVKGYIKIIADNNVVGDYVVASSLLLDAKYELTDKGVCAISVNDTGLAVLANRDNLATAIDCVDWSLRWVTVINSSTDTRVTYSVARDVFISVVQKLQRAGATYWLSKADTVLDIIQQDTPKDILDTIVQYGVL